MRWCASGKIERPATSRVKTDRRDVERLVRLLMIGGFHPVRVLMSDEEAMRDLVRAREYVRGDLNARPPPRCQAPAADTISASSAATGTRGTANG